MSKTGSIILCAALLLFALAGCKGTPEPTPTPSQDVTQVPDDIIDTPSPEVSETPDPEESETPSPEVTPVPENPAAAEREPTVEMEFLVEGLAETVTVNLETGEFENGPAISLYVDESRYAWTEMENGTWLAAPPAAEDEDPRDADCWLEVNFVPGKDADGLAPGLLDGYDEIRSMSDEGTVAFADGRARLVTGEGALGRWQAWIIDLPEGAVTLVLRYTQEMAENAAVRLTAIADTLRIVSRY